MREVTEETVSLTHDKLLGLGTGPSFSLLRAANL
jgi:hypothetical protein